MRKHRLVLYAHGSEDPRWRQPFEDLTVWLQESVGRERLSLAYMEFARPTLREVARQAERDGVEKVVILPLFLAAGAHLSKDLPEQVAAVQMEFTRLQINVLPPAGEDSRMAAVLREIALEKLRELEYSGGQQ